MPGNPLHPRLNGSDYLMLGFDHESRRLGFSGNSCQILLELAAPVTAAALQARLADVYRQYPVLGARSGGWWRPHWRLPDRAVEPAEVVVHRLPAVAPNGLFNTPLNTGRGQMIRFELLEQEGRPAQVLFTWAHALMDAPSAEYFLSVVGRPELPWPAPHAEGLVPE